MKKSFNNRRRLILAGVILVTVAGGVVFEERHRAETVPAHHSTAGFPASAAVPGAEFIMTNKNFEAGMDLWLNPVVRSRDAEMTYANYIFQSDLHFSMADFARLTTPGNAGQIHVPLMTLTDKDIDYALISLGNFKASLTLTPVKAKPEDLFPTLLKPGLGGSFNF